MKKLKLTCNSFNINIQQVFFFEQRLNYQFNLKNSRQDEHQQCSKKTANKTSLSGKVATL